MPTEPTHDDPNATTSPSEAPDGTPPPPTKAPRRRRATSSTAAGKAAPAAEADPTAAPAAETDPTAAPAAETDPTAAPKKAPRKRAPRKTAAKPSDSPSDGRPPEETGATATPPAVTDATTGRTRGRARSVAAPSAGDAGPAAVPADAEPVGAEVEDGTVAAAAVEDGPVVPADSAVSPAPVKRARARKAPAVVPFQAPEPAAEQEPAAPVRRRRRAGTEGAVAPTALLPTLVPPVPATADEAGELDEEELAEQLAEDPADEAADRPRRRRRGRRGRGRRPEGAEDDEDDDEDETSAEEGSEEETSEDDEDEDDETAAGTRRRRRRRRGSGGGSGDADAEPGTVVHMREPRQARVRGAGAADEDGVRGISGSTRMAAKRVRRQEGRDSGRRRQPILSEAEFLARREAVDRVMVVRQVGDRTQIAVLEDGILVEHYVTRTSAQSFAGNVYLGRVQNVLPSMEAAFVDIGKGRNAVLYAGEVNWAELGGGQRKIESALSSGQEVLVQVTKDPIGHKGARLTGQISLPGRYLVYVPEGAMTGISRKLPEPERDRLKAILKTVVPDGAGVIIRTAAEGAAEEEIAGDVRRLQAQWEVIKTKAAKGGAPTLLHAEPDLVIRVIRDVFNEDFRRLVVQGDSEWETIRDYVEFVAPDLAERLARHTAETDVFAEHRVDEQIAKALDRKVFLPSGGSLVIDRTEAMVVIDVNTGKYVGKGGNLEETVTRNNLEAAEEIARQLRLRDLGGIIVVDFIDMVLESNRDLVVRRLVECMARDRTKHQVAEVTSLGLVQMTRKRVGQGLLESFSEPCDRCNGRGVLVSTDPVDAPRGGGSEGGERRERGRARGRGERARDAAPAVPAGDAPRAGGPVPAGDADPAGDAVPQPPTAAADRPADGESRGKRRRRSGRGSGAATVPPSDEVAELLAPDAPAEPAYQPGSDEQDRPVLPPESASAPAAAPPAPAAAAVSPPGPGAADPPAAEPASAPQDPPAPDAAAPRRRRRATSRPAGPPLVE